VIREGTFMPVCEVCGERPAKYVCQNCGRLVCESCVAPEGLLCPECSTLLDRREEIEASQFNVFSGFLNPINLFFMSVLLIFIGFFCIMLGSIIGGRLEGLGAIIMIGPIPIIVGAGPLSMEVILIGVVVTIIAVILFALSLYERRRSLSS